MNLELLAVFGLGIVFAYLLDSYRFARSIRLSERKWRRRP
jgi:hypothetical protein